jgi:hypothetical protein
MGNADTRSATRINRTIYLPFFQQNYNANVDDPVEFRKCIDGLQIAARVNRKNGAGTAPKISSSWLTTAQ